MMLKSMAFVNDFICSWGSKGLIRREFSCLQKECADRVYIEGNDILSYPADFIF